MTTQLKQAVKNNNKKMKTIKKISGDVLLYLYSLQRKNGFPTNDVITFSGLNDGKIKLESKSMLTETLLKLTDNSIPDLFNSIRYLKNKEFIFFKDDQDSMDYIIFNIDVSEKGIDIIEGIERGDNERKEFNITFNIKLADNINVENLVKAELGSLIKNSLL